MAFGEFTEGHSVQKAGAPLKPDATSTMSMGADAGGTDKSIEGLIDSVSTSIGADRLSCRTFRRTDLEA